MAVAFARTASANSGSVTGTSAAVTLGSSPVNGEVMIVAITVGLNGTTITAAPSGWTLKSGPDTTGSLVTWLYEKVASSEGTTPTYTWTLSGAVNWTVNFESLSGGDSTTFKFAYTAGPTASPVVTPSVTTLVNGCAVVSFVSAYQALSNNGPVFTAPAQVTLDSQSASSAGVSNNTGAAVGHATTNQTTAGATATRSFTVGTINNSAAYTATVGPLAAQLPRPTVAASVAANRASNR